MTFPPVVRRRLVGLYVAGLAAFVVAGAALVPFHGDESIWLYMSRDYDDLFLGGDLNRLLYSDTPADPEDQGFRELNNPLGKYAIALSWHAAGFTVADINGYYVWGAGWDWNVENGRIPSDALLFAGRWLPALLAGLSLGALLALGKQAGGWPVGLLAVGLLAFDASFLLHTRRAMAEGMLMATGILSIWLTAVYLRKAPDLSLRRRTAYLLGLGLLVGLCVATKLNGAIIALVVAAGLFAIPLLFTNKRKGGSETLLHKKITQEEISSVSASNPSIGAQGIKSPAGGTGATPPQKDELSTQRSESILKQSALDTTTVAIVALLIVFALSPYLWRNPVARVRDTFSDMNTLVVAQKQGRPSLDTPGQRVGGLIEQTFFSSPAYYEDVIWSEWVGDQIARYEASLLSGWRRPVWAQAVLAALFVVGLLAPRFQTPARLPSANDAATAARGLILLWLAIAALVNLIIVPFAWERYYLLLWPPVAVMQANGAVFVWRWIVARRAPNPPPAQP